MRCQGAVVLRVKHIVVSVLLAFLEHEADVLGALLDLALGLRERLTHLQGDHGSVLGHSLLEQLLDRGHSRVVAVVLSRGPVPLPMKLEGSPGAVELGVDLFISVARELLDEFVVDWVDSTVDFCELGHLSLLQE